MDLLAKNKDWAVTDEHTGKCPSWERVGVAVLMDIRRELEKLNGLLACDNFLSIPQILREIENNTRLREIENNTRKKKRKIGGSKR